MWLRTVLNIEVKYALENSKKKSTQVGRNYWMKAKEKEKTVKRGIPNGSAIEAMAKQANQISKENEVVCQNVSNSGRGPLKKMEMI